METTLHNSDLNTLEQLREEKEALKRRLAERSLKNEPSSTSNHLVYADDLKLLHELQVHQLEIEMQDAELRSSHLIQEEFDIKHNDLFEFAPYGYFMLNLEGEIQKINLIGTTLLGIKRSALINESFEKFILNDNKEKFQTCWSNLIETKTRQVCEVKIFQPNGQKLFLRIALSITKYQNTFQILAATTDITMEKQIEDTQSFLLGNSWSKAGHDFFEELAEFLYKALGVDYVCIDKLFKDGLEAETVAVYFDGKFEDSVRYTLEDTPCGKVSGQQVCCFPGKVRELFPKDEVLQEMVAESYAGITLWSTADKAIGLIAVIGRKPLVDIKLTELVLKQVSIRAASELEHRQAEEVLKESEERYRASFESNLDAILITYLNGGIEAANAEACRMFGMTEQEIINGGRNAVVDLSDPRLKVALEERERTGRFRGELNFKRKDGTIFPVDESNVVYKDKNGIQKTIMVIRDITERKKAEELILETEREFILLAESIPQLVWTTRADGWNTYFNHQWVEYTGLTLEESYGHGWNIPFHPDDQQIAWDSWQNAVQNNADYSLRCRLRRADGVYKWWLIYGVPDIDENGQITKWYGTCTDINEMKQAEDLLRESEERYRAHFESSIDGFMITFPDGRIESANPEACRMLGMTEQELIRVGRNAIVDLSDPRLKVALEERKRTGRFRGELNFKRKDGTIFPVDESCVVYKDKNGIHKTIKVIRDITERKLAEDALKNSEERLKTLYKSMNEGLVNHTVVYENEIAVDYIIDDINPAFEKLTGFDRNTSIGKSASELYGTETPPYLDIYARVAETGISDYFETYFPPTEKHFGISVFSPGKGTFATIFTDITLRKKNEEKLKELNKTFLTLSKSSHAMANSVEEIKYLNQVCNIVLEDCGFKMVWVGFAENDEAKTLRPIASAGFDDDYPNTIPLSWGDNEFGQGPTGTAIRTGEISSCRNMLTDPAFEPWREEAVKRGYASFIVFPLITDKHAFGAITIYSSEPDPFNEDQIEMLSKLANDMAHGIATIRLREAHRKTEIALWKSLENLEKLVKLRTRELEITNEHLNNEIKIRVEQEQHLVLAEEKYRTVADFTYNMETWIDTNGNYIYVSPSCERVTGYNASDFFNDSKLLVHIAHPDDRELVKEYFEEKIKGTIPSGDIDFRIITKEGKERWIGHSCQSVFNAEGKCLGQRGSNRNINKQKRAEIVLLESENHLRELAHRMDSIAEDERIRVAREIHDEIGHLLTALKYDTEGLINHSEFSPERVKEELTGMISLIEVLIDSVRKIATELRPGILDHMGLLAALEWKIKQFRLKNKICSEYKIDEMDVEFTKNETTFIYRILQEIFTNAMRYSKATHMWISITKKDDFFSMKVRDNGVGFDVASTLQKGSLGLMGMRERAISIGGEIQIESTPGNGTTTTFLLRK